MKLYKVNNLEEYVKVIKSTLDTGSENCYGNDAPLFTSEDDFINYFKLDESKIWNEDGEFILKEDEPIPDSIIEDGAKRIIEEYELKFPFYIVISGERGFDRLGNYEMRTFLEIQDVETL